MQILEMNENNRDIKDFNNKKDALIKIINSVLQ